MDLSLLFEEIKKYGIEKGFLDSILEEEKAALEAEIETARQKAL